jgi:hypothetical protein
LAYKLGDRDQITLLLPTIEESVGEDDPVRAYDAFHPTTIIVVVECGKDNQMAALEKKALVVILFVPCRGRGRRVVGRRLSLVDALAAAARARSSNVLVQLI